MSEMVERVARALCAEAGRDPDKIAFPSEAFQLWRFYIKGARAALAAQREPTEAMLAAECDTVTGGRQRLSDYLDYVDARSVWRAMNDEALK